MRFLPSPRQTAAVASLCAALFAAPEAHAQTLVPVDPPDFIIPFGYDASWTYPTAGWAQGTGGAGDRNANPAENATKSGTPKMRRVGMYSSTGPNFVELTCDPNIYKVFKGNGTTPIGAAYDFASKGPNHGNCVINVTIGTGQRTAVANPPKPLPAPSLFALPAPDSSVPYTFDVTGFANQLEKQIEDGKPAPYGYELAIADAGGKIVYNRAFGSATATALNLPPTIMTPDRRFDVNSMSKTITATATMAAFEQIAEHKPALNVTLDSSILPYMPIGWAAHAGPGVAQVTFRSLLRHTSGFCKDGNDDYASLETMVMAGVCPKNVGTWNYYDYNYALLRVVLAYLIDGPETFRYYEGIPELNAKLTALSYRNFVRNRVFDPIGLASVDEYYIGPEPETVFFSGGSAVPDGLNIAGSPCVDRHADTMVLTTGSGRWNLTAKEYAQFISSLWRGDIVSQESLKQMREVDSVNTFQGIGIYGSQPPLSPAPAGGNPYWDFNHNGGGCGESGDWITFFNGYTAVILSNSDWSIGDNESGVLEAAFAANVKHK